MAQVMVNFRVDEDVKRDMEQACREMGLSMTAAFTLFAKKVGKEKRIPFEITAESCGAGGYRRQYGPVGTGQSWGEGAPAFARKQERLELLCAEIRRSLTAMYTAIPASITGLSIERIRLLCGDELKDKAAGTAGAVRALFSPRNAGLLGEKDTSILNEYIDGLSSAAERLRETERTLIPAMKAWHGEDTGAFEPYGQRLAEISREFDALAPVMQRFLCSTACGSGARAVETRIRQAAAGVETAYVRTALDGLESRLLRDYDCLEEQIKARVEGDYLQTLELALRGLGQAEEDGGDVGGKAALCLRAINVLSQVISGGVQARREWDGLSLEAEVAALERLAALRGDIGSGIKPD